MDVMQQRARRIIERFPGETVTIRRPGLSYGHPDGTYTDVGTATVYRMPRPTPEKWRLREAALNYDDDNDLWVCLPWSADLPAVLHGDRVTLADGTAYTLRNIHNRGDVRVFWQLHEEG